MSHVVFGTNQTFNTTDVIRVHNREQPSTHGCFVTDIRCFIEDKQ